MHLGPGRQKATECSHRGSHALATSMDGKRVFVPIDFIEPEHAGFGVVLKRTIRKQPRFFVRGCNEVGDGRSQFFGGTFFGGDFGKQCDRHTYEPSGSNRSGWPGE